MAKWGPVFGWHDAVGIVPEHLMRQEIVNTFHPLRTLLITSSFPRGITYNFKYFCPKKYKDFDKHLTKLVLKDFQLF